LKEMVMARECSRRARDPLAGFRLAGKDGGKIERESQEFGDRINLRSQVATGPFKLGL